VENLPALARKVISLRKWLISSSEKQLAEGRVGIVHGDLNLGNIMVEKDQREPLAIHDEPWLIDFAKTRRDRIVYDFCQFEVDLFARSLRTDFFPSGKNGNFPAFNEVDALFGGFLRAPWQTSPVAEKSCKLRFIYEAMRSVREAAEAAGVGEREYLFTRCLELLVTHKIKANLWLKSFKDKKEGDKNLEFIASLTLWMAFENARHLGWRA
jgi:hypothetical protein